MLLYAKRGGLKTVPLRGALLVARIKQFQIVILTATATMIKIALNTAKVDATA